MNYKFIPISYFEVLEMESWRWSGYETQIYMDRYHESYKKGENPIRGPRGCHGFSTYNEENILFGLLEFYFEDDGVYLGLAINPRYVGRGLSTEFIDQGILFFQQYFKSKERVKIEVHRKNIQGIKAYEKCGFKFSKRDGDILLYERDY